MSSAEVVRTAYISKGPCRCGAHRLHRVFQFYWSNPSATRGDAARALKTTGGNVREAMHVLRRRDLSRTCPECFSQELLRGVCQKCGFEPEAPAFPFEVTPDSQSPTNHLFAGNQLGSETDYRGLAFENHWAILKRRVEGKLEDSLVRAVKSDVENELKRSFPEESVTDEAGRLALKEVWEFRSRYPGLATSKNLRRQLAENVINRLRLLHPQLRPVSPLVEGS